MLLGGVIPQVSLAYEACREQLELYHQQLDLDRYISIPDNTRPDSNRNVPIQNKHFICFDRITYPAPEYLAIKNVPKNCRESDT